MMQLTGSSHSTGFIGSSTKYDTKLWSRPRLRLGNLQNRCSRWHTSLPVTDTGDLPSQWNKAMQDRCDPAAEPSQPINHHDVTVQHTTPLTLVVERLASFAPCTLPAVALILHSFTLSVTPPIFPRGPTSFQI